MYPNYIYLPLFASSAYSENIELEKKELQSSRKKDIKLIFEEYEG